jgi:hypothetical protein
LTPHAVIGDLGARPISDDRVRQWLRRDTFRATPPELLVAVTNLRVARRASANWPSAEKAYHRRSCDRLTRSSQRARSGCRVRRSNTLRGRNWCLQQFVASAPRVSANGRQAPRTWQIWPSAVVRCDGQASLFDSLSSNATSGVWAGWMKRSQFAPPTEGHARLPGEPVIPEPREPGFRVSNGRCIQNELVS